MTESFPRQEARTRRFTLGVPRAFLIAPDGSRVAYLRTPDGADPVTCLWLLDVASGAERLVVDPRTLGGGEEDLPPEERARRERVREQAGGIVAYATDTDLTLAVFSWSGRVWAVDLTGAQAAAREIRVPGPALEPRPDPAGKRLAYVRAGSLRVADLGSAAGEGPGKEQVLAGPEGEGPVTFGLAEFIAAEEMDRQRGYWWSPDGSALLVARVDEAPVTRWRIADPANPERPPAEVGYPAAGTPNAAVSLLLARLDGSTVDVDVDWDAFPYLVTACWEAGHDPLVLVQSRDQRTMRLLAVDPGTGRTGLLREDTNPRWLEIVPGVPAWTADGRLVWAADREDTRRLLVGRPAEGAAGPVTPPGLQLRAVLAVDGDTVLFQASAEPAETSLWSYGPDGLSQVGEGGGMEGGARAGGTTVLTRRSLAGDGVTVRVYRDGRQAAAIASLAETPALPAPQPVLFGAGAREIRTAVLFPSWHQTGRGTLPVLLDPYGGPHGQRVVRARGAYLTSQWFAEQGFAVVVADGRGTPGRGPEWERAVAGDLAGPVLEDQVEALREAASRFADLDTGRVAIRGWSFGGFLAALAVLRRPDVFHAAVAGAPVTDWRLYDTHYTERYLGHPGSDPGPYQRSSLLNLPERPGLVRPLMLIHGLADDNVVVAHTLRLSSALLAAGYPHTVLPLSGITHMASQETVEENLLLLQLDFLRRALPG